MCGFAGIINEKCSEVAVKEMLKTIGHRGPDAMGIFIEEGCSLGHNRLSIIDLSEEANQPFVSPDGRYQLVFNGEIYNYPELQSELKDRYQFKTSSDTEVLLAAYITFGKDCLEKLNGMFAFAIWDGREKKLFAARDRFGVKPFYYSIKGKELLFASEIKVFRNQINCRYNERVWANYFCFGSYGLPEETFYKDVLQLPAGHFMEYKGEKLHVERWYDFVERVKERSPEIRSESEIKKQYLELLEDAVKLRFRSDVEVGFNLSGGVDSSLLLALVNHFHPSKNIKAFTFYTGDEKYDELYWVEKMIKKTGNSLEKIKLSPEEVPELSQKISNFQDEPFGGIPTLAYSKIFKKASEQGIKVLLDGQGMDEQWAGYDYYGKNANSLIQGSNNTSPFRKEVFKGDFLKQSEKPEYPKPFRSEIQNTQFRDLFFTKMPRALRFNDRVSMASSSELREPFLDYRLVEMAFALPDRTKIRGNVHKYLLRQIIKEYVPFEIAEAPKRALQTPQREWLGGELKGFVEQSFQRLEESEIATWFDFESLLKEWEFYQEGDKQNSFYIWQWINAALLIENCQ